MTSREEFAAFASGQQQTNGDWTKSWARQQQSTSPAKSRPPQAPKSEMSPLLSPPWTNMPPMPQSALPPPQSQPPMSVYEQLKASRPRGHGRSRSEFLISVPVVPIQSDPAHPFNKSPPPPGPAGVGSKRSNRPPRSGVPQSMTPPPPPSGEFMSPLSWGSPPLGNPGTAPSRKKVAHRRIKSDIPLNLYGDGGSVLGREGRLITKADLLKNLPSPRWGRARPQPMHARNRSRTGSDGPLLSDAGSVSSGGYGATTSIHSTGGDFNRGHLLLQSIGSVELAPDSKRPTRHARAQSDASIRSVTTDMAKSALFKGVTDTGRIRLQLPKDSFRILLDSSLEAGCVYKRKLVDSEDEFFVEFHTVDEGGADPVDACHCTCEGCNRCNEKQKRLPPDLYVMAVDSTIYRRMLDEVIDSKTMPCGTFFCGHHEDVRHPDVTIAALIVGVVFFVLLVGTVMMGD